jgi:serine/threonine protein kinase
MGHGTGVASAGNDQKRSARMTPEDWQRVKPILAAALELDSANRTSFLKEACADPSLREEIQSLIVAHEKANTDALNSAAFPSFSESAPSARPQLTNGTRLGDFQILSLLGAGGMGEVYRARDLRLERDVAIKVLPKFVSLDPERLLRFEQEAKAAAGLSHPNILAVFQMGTHEGVSYLVAELLPKSGVNCVIFVQICPKIDICSQNLCSSWSNFTKVASAFQRFQPVNSTQYLLGLLSNEGRVD